MAVLSVVAGWRSRLGRPYGKCCRRVYSRDLVRIAVRYLQYGYRTNETMAIHNDHGDPCVAAPIWSARDRRCSSRGPAQGGGDHDMQESREQLKCDLRWSVRRDLPEILEIERQSFEFYWTEEDFLCCLRDRSCIGMVAEHNGRIVGFFVYELLMSKLHLLNFAVAPMARRQGVGTQMVCKLINKLSQQRRQAVILEVRETNLGAQLFFQKMGFLASREVLRGHYEDTEEDAYQMAYAI